MMSVRRSLLFVPGDDARKIDRACGSAADTLLFDLEDAVAPAHKGDARRRVAAALSALPDHFERAVRINPRTSPHHDEDLAAIVAAGADALMLPKCASGADVAATTAAIDRLSPTSPLRLLALVETAAGILALDATWADARLDALCFGHVDLAADMGLAEADASQGVLAHARCRLALAARAASVAAIDSACLEYRDLDRCAAAARAARDLGYSGKLCIHPAQCEPVNAAFTPTAAEVAQAEEILAAWEDAGGDAVGVVAVAGAMVDAPVVAMQRALLGRSRAIAQRQKEARSHS